MLMLGGSIRVCECECECECVCLANQESLSVDVGRVHQSCQSLTQHNDSNGHQEQRVDKATEYLHTTVPEGVNSAGMIINCETVRERERDRKRGREREGGGV